MACIIDSWVPTASMTECAPRPLVRSFTRSTPASPRSSTMWVPPYSKASCWRGWWRLIAMILSAPSCFAARTPSRPTAPSPTTATVLPGPAWAATAPNQPVPSTSEAANRLGMRSSAGRSGVATGLPLDAGRLVPGSADLAGVVRGEERADHELTRLDGGDLVADLLDHADVLVAHRRRAVVALDAPVGPQVGAAHAGRGQPQDRVGGLDDGGAVAVFDADVAGGVEDCSSHAGAPASLGLGARVRASTRLMSIEPGTSRTREVAFMGGRSTTSLNPLRAVAWRPWTTAPTSVTSSPPGVPG